MDEVWEAIQAIGEAVEGEVSQVYTVDISFQVDGETVEPQAPVDVTVTHENVAGIEAPGSPMAGGPISPLPS